MLYAPPVDIQTEHDMFASRIVWFYLYCVLTCTCSHALILSFANTCNTKIQTQQPRKYVALGSGGAIHIWILNMYIFTFEAKRWRKIGDVLYAPPLDTKTANGKFCIALVSFLLRSKRCDLQLQLILSFASL